MKIAFWMTTPKTLDINEIDAGRIICGGTERELLCLASELNKAYTTSENPHPIFIFGDVKERGGIYGQALFYHYTDLPLVLAQHQIDAFIVVRAHDTVLSPRRGRFLFDKQRPRKVILWSGDNYDTTNNEILYDKLVTDNLDYVVLKSEWQKDIWFNYFPRLKDKITVIRKGLDVGSMPIGLEPVSKPKFIYASVAFRGLSRFLQIWPKIKAEIPRATLDCLAKTTLYQDNNPQEKSYLELYQQIAALPGVTLKEPLPQKDFFELLPSYYAMLYPNCGFDETVCGAALEAMACGVPVITSARAGLVETVKAGDGILIGDDPHSLEYENAFVRATLDLWMNPKKRDRMGEYGFREIREHYNIKETVKDWQNLLEGAA